MGSKCAPSVGCTYMGEFERQHVYTYHLQPFLWLQYVDDVFCLWNHGDAAFQLFVDYLNSREGRIKFTCHSLTTSVEFLDTTVHIKDGVLNTEFFIKPTNSLSYLQRTSFHPKQTFTSLPYGEFVRAWRNCSTAEAFEIYSLKINSAFQARGCDTSVLEASRLKARSLSRNDLFDAYKQIPDITIDRSDVHAKGQGQRSKVKVTEFNTQLSRFQTVTPVWIHIWWWNDAQSLMLLIRGALLFFKVIRQISRSHG